MLKERKGAIVGPKVAVAILVIVIVAATVLYIGWNFITENLILTSD